MGNIVKQLLPRLIDHSFMELLHVLAKLQLKIQYYSLMTWDREAQE